MTKDQEGYIKASIARALFLTNNGAIVNGLPSYTTYFTIIQTTNGQAQVVMVQQEAKKKNGTSNKDAIKKQLISQTMDLVRKGLSLAMNTNNVGLQESLNYKESGLIKSTDTKLGNQCQVVYDVIKANLAALNPYGVTDAVLATFLATIKSFSAAISKLRLDKADGNAATKQLKTLIDTLKLNWGKVDVLVDMVKLTQPAFYDEYQVMRKVIIVGGSSLSLKVIVRNAATGAPEAGVTITVVAADEATRMAKVASAKEIVKKKTAAAGGSYIKGLADGVYDVTVEKPGKQPVSKTANVVGGELNTIEFEI